MVQGTNDSVLPLRCLSARSHQSSTLIENENVLLFNITLQTAQRATDIWLAGVGSGHQHLGGGTDPKPNWTHRAGLHSKFAVDCR